MRTTLLVLGLVFVPFLGPCACLGPSSLLSSGCRNLHATDLEVRSMFPGGGRGGGMNPKQVSAMMKQMGITMEDVDEVEEVIIRTRSEDIVIVEAEVSKMIAKAGTTWQIAGRETRRPREAPKPAAAPGPIFTEDDVTLVAEQAKVSKDEARKALVAAKGEAAEAILKLLGDDA